MSLPVLNVFPPRTSEARPPDRDRPEAWVSLLSSERYVTGLIALWLSLRRVGTEYPLWAVIDGSISAESLARLDAAGIHHCPLDFEVKLDPELVARNETLGYGHWTATYGRLGLFSTNRWRKLVSIDSDMMVVRNIDSLFAAPHLSAVRAGRSFPGLEHWVELNGGLIVIEPHEGLAEELVAAIPRVEAEAAARGETGPIGDQNIFHHCFADWPTTPALHLHEGNNVFLEHVDHYLKLFEQSGEGRDALRIVHFVGGQKPWDLGWFELLRAAYRFVATGRPRAAQYLLAYAWLLRAAGHRF